MDQYYYYHHYHRSQAPREESAEKKKKWSSAKKSVLCALLDNVTEALISPNSFRLVHMIMLMMGFFAGPVEAIALLRSFLDFY